MATLSSAGIGSGLDVNSLVTQLVDAERAPQSNALDKKEASVQQQLSAIGAFKSALSALQDSIKSLANGSVFGKQSATPSDASLFTATTDGTAVAGTYSVHVDALAKAHKLASAAFGSSTAIGTGTLTITVGTQSFDVTIDGTINTLAGIRDAINAAADNAGVKATVVNATDGAHLVLTSNNTGAAFALTVTQSGGDGGLASLVYDPAHGATALTEKSPAQDAQATIEGFVYKSSTNTITGAIPGVTLTLNKSQDPAEDDASIAVGADRSSLNSSVATFVNAYNQLSKLLTQLTAYNPDTRVAGPLLGDATALSVSSQLRRLIGGSIGNQSNYTTLSSVGITTQADGTLALDAAKLSAALDANPAAVKTLFSDADVGVASRLSDNLQNYLSASGAMQARMDGANSTLKDIQHQRDQLDARMSALEDMYRKQFTALDTLIGQLQQTSSFLTQQLSSLNALAGISSK
ncbi:MAG TPA: flagellar filament capping protein FliD [Nevskiaceae bacterium]|nr:flagellar filament capping protein FliD [Nevskiaceae bacterium]